MDREQVRSLIETAFGRSHLMDGYFNLYHREKPKLGFWKVSAWTAAGLSMGVVLVVLIMYLQTIIIQ